MSCPVSWFRWLALPPRHRWDQQLFLCGTAGYANDSAGRWDAGSVWLSRGADRGTRQGETLVEMAGNEEIRGDRKIKRRSRRRKRRWRWRRRGGGEGRLSH